MPIKRKGYKEYDGPPMIAIISDLHANAEALNAVLEDADRMGADRIVCLGDIVGYGPDPVVCTDIVMSRAHDATIVGNHDYALIHGPVGFNYIAAGVIHVTRKAMDPAAAESCPNIAECANPIKGDGIIECARDRMLPKCFEMKHSRREHWEFIDRLPGQLREKDLLFVHGSPLIPIWEYVLPDIFAAAWDTGRLAEMFEKVEWLCFCGHTHFPCAITGDYRCVYPADVRGPFKLRRDLKYIINAGSVGQPRDGDNRSCYVLFDEKSDTMEWRRVPYDIEAVVEKVARTCGIDNRCGTRLREGR